MKNLLVVLALLVSGCGQGSASTANSPNSAEQDDSSTFILACNGKGESLDYSENSPVNLPNRTPLTISAHYRINLNNRTLHVWTGESWEPRCEPSDDCFLQTSPEHISYFTRTEITGAQPQSGRGYLSIDRITGKFTDSHKLTIGESKSETESSGMCVKSRQPDVEKVGAQF